MDKFSINENPNRKVASEIIDMILQAVYDEHPDLSEYISRQEGNTLLYGSAYYNLEDELTRDLPTMVNVEVD